MDNRIISDKELLAHINRFRKLHDLSATRFGELAAGDRSLVPNIQKGRSLTLKNAASLLKWMSEYDPTNPTPRKVGQKRRPKRVMPSDSQSIAA